MILYCIVRSQANIQNKQTFDFLKSAAADRGLEFIVLESDTINYATVRDQIVPGSLLYRIAGGSRSLLLEALIDDKVTTLRSGMLPLLARQFNWGAAIRLQAAQLPIIPTIFNVDRAQDAHLESYVEQLGGFPIILKSAGGSHGSGVMRLDSLPALRSVLDYVSNGSSDFVLRKYISNARHLRIIVIGSEVKDVIEYKSQSGDFRTNAVATPQVEVVKDLPGDIAASAVSSVHDLGLEFGGIDVLVDENGDYHIAEVNFPCNFARNQANTGADIAGMIIDYLLKKRSLID